MSLLSPQVDAFIAVIEEASFDKAAKKLNVTPSAISQRLRTLEDRIGQLLVVRQTPCRPTRAGEQLLSRVKSMALLEAEVMADLLPEQHSQLHAKPFPIAVNEDSLSTWLLNALTDLHQEYGHKFDIRVDDQEYTLEHLKNGDVLGAITSEKTPLQGCAVHFLGNMRYCAIASPQFAARYFAQGLTTEAFLNAPVMIYNRKDPLQMRFMQKVTGSNITPHHIHYLPDSVSLVEAAKRHMGWCVSADGLFEEAIAANSLVNLAPEVWLNEPHYWQHAAVNSKGLTQITNGFFQASKGILVR